IFVGNRPPRSFACKSQFALHCSAVNFDYDSINFIRKRLAFPLPFADELPDFVEVRRESASRIDFESGSVERVQGIPMLLKDYRCAGGDGRASIPLGRRGPRTRKQHIGKIIQTTLRGNARLQLTHGTSSGVARICEL